MGGGAQRGLSDKVPDAAAAEAAAPAGKTDRSLVPRLPLEKPPFTLSDIKAAIPPHCFHRSLLTSSAYLLKDLAQVALLFFLTRFFDSPPAVLAAALPAPVLAAVWPAVSVVLWATYFVVQGFAFSFVWVIAHECGHGAFSDYSSVNDTVGFVLHSLLLAPYFSWKYAHKRHHHYTNSMEHDEAFVPPLVALPGAELLQLPAVRAVVLTTVLLVSWPLHILVNFGGAVKDGATCWINPFSCMFSPPQRLWVLVSDLGMLATLAGTVAAASQLGFWWVFKVYLAPLCVTNALLVIVTWLQHTHTSLPHFDDSEWEWLRGNLCTIDRDFGFLNALSHNITYTHVMHHLFPAMPHYHSLEATKAVLPVLQGFYLTDPTPVATALWNVIHDCLYVKPDSQGSKGIFWYVGADTKASGKAKAS